MKNKKLWAVTLAELLISITIMGLMFSMLTAVVVLVKKSYNDEKSRSELQQTAALVLSKLTRELMESSYKTTTIYNPSTASPPTGIIFGSARDPGNHNKFDLDPNFALCVWHKYICYYIDADPESPAQKALFRREFYISTPTMVKSPCGLSTINFSNAGSDSSYSSAIIIAHKLEDLDFPDLGVGAPSFTSNQIALKLPLKVDLKIAERKVSSNTYNSIKISFTININN